jgi:hypothetical protein
LSRTSAAEARPPGFLGLEITTYVVPEPTEVAWVVGAALLLWRFGSGSAHDETVGRIQEAIRAPASRKLHALSKTHGLSG